MQLGYLSSELDAYHDEFAYRPATEEAADHISVEAGFVSFLLLKQAFAEASGSVDAVAVTEEARRTFLKEHLAWIAEPLAERLEASSVEYLALSGRSLCDRVGPSQERRALPTGVLPSCRRTATSAVGAMGSPGDGWSGAATHPPPPLPRRQVLQEDAPRLAVILRQHRS